MKLAQRKEHKMKIENHTSWVSDNGVEVLRKLGPGRYYIPLANVEAEILQTLRDACEDALKDQDEREISGCSGTSV